MHVLYRIGTLPLLLATCGGVLAQAPATDVTWDLRLRHEQVDDDGFARTAEATTFRLRSGLRVAFAHGWSALIEGEGIVNTNDRYNSGANGRTAYPAVIDPEGLELNQAWLAWHGERLGGTLGRQRILLDNQRFVGNVGWRQNEQTFDALTAQWQPSEALSLRYSMLDRVHRVFSDEARDPLARERSLDSHLLNAAFKRGGQAWTGYAYLHEDRDVATASSATYGVRWTGSRVADGHGWGFALEAARQQDYANSALDFSHSYWLVEPAWTYGGVMFKAGWEHLGGNGSHAFQTPLATLHAFNGWADKFLTTPAGGLEDRYLSAAGKFGQIRDGQFGWALTFHDFRAAHNIAGSDRYGQEWDASLGMPVAPGVQALVKLADYASDGFARDTTNLWLQLEWSGQK